MKQLIELLTYSVNRHKFLVMTLSTEKQYVSCTGLDSLEQAIEYRDRQLNDCQPGSTLAILNVLESETVE